MDSRPPAAGLGQALPTPPTLHWHQQVGTGLEAGGPLPKGGGGPLPYGPGHCLEDSTGGEILWR